MGSSLLLHKKGPLADVAPVHGVHGVPGDAFVILAFSSGVELFFALTAPNSDPRWSARHG